MKSKEKQAIRLATALGILLVLTIVLSAAVSIWALRQQEIDKWQEQSEAFSLMLAENTAQQLGTAYLALDNVVERIQDRYTVDADYLRSLSRNADLHQMLAEKQALSEQLDVIFVLDSKGSLIVSSRRFPSPDLNFEDRDYFRMQRDDPSVKTNISTSLLSKSTGKWTFIISRRLTGSDGEFIGVAGIGVAPSFYSRFYEKINMKGQATITLLRDDFSILARWPERDELMGKQNLSDSTYAFVHDQKKKSGVFITDAKRARGGDSSSVSMAAIQVLDKYPVIVNFTIGEAIYLADWRRISRIIVIVAMGSVIAVIMAFSLLLALLKRREADLRTTNELKQQAEIINRNQSYLLQNLTHQQRELKEAADRFQAVFQNAADGIVMIDQHGNLEVTNPAWRRIYGYKESEVAGKSGSLFCPPNGQDMLALAANHAEFVQQGNVHLEDVRMRKDGSLFPAELSISEYYFSGEKKYVVIVRDISERRQIERMKSEFISTVSHELRTPLTAIRGALGLVLGGAAGDLPVKIQELISISHKNSESLTRLINDLLDSQKIEAGKMDFHYEVLPLDELLKTAVQANQAFAANLGVGIRLSGAPVMDMVKVDAGRFQQVMANLLSNACKYSPRGEDVVVLAMQLSSERVRVEVIDQGSGIPVHFQQKIFQKFSQADASDSRAKGGTGLGLAISQAIMQQMYGEIGCHPSNSMAGTCFYIELPIAQMAPGPAISDQSEIA
ncbi:PAS domain S-box protein [Undibacterium sp. Jales W-56]|uniref:PAS domain S-box protein n=1 Tax=Undibacterium sp. Jales W-56 TaxID=2897325 RepID=UPI0021D098F6|nr:PAS domain S-box protein [Undibacterium sp. Jales W-56]MCU6434165.1 PAS domain S-box protein [Undibacterium sp. Jales W-56]